MLRTFAVVFTFILSSSASFAQKMVRYRAIISEDCSEAIWLSDATRQFVFDRNCDGISEMCFGTWGLKDDTLILNPFVNTAVGVIDTVMASGDDKERIALKVLDKNGEDMSEKVWACVRPEGRASVFFTSAPDGGKAVMRLEGKIALFTLEKLFNRTIEFPITEASDYTVKLKFTQEYIPDGESTWLDIGMVKLVKINDQFMTVTEDKELALYFTRDKN